mgnify:FL=1
MNLHYDHYKETVLDTVIKEEKDGYYCFEDTIFYGEKGGMPSDKGTINGLEVLDLKWDGDTLYHKVNGELSNPIHMEVDLFTRHTNTIVQSALHIADGFCVKHNFPLGSIGTNHDNIWYEINTEVDDKTLDELEQYVRQAILDSIDVEISYVAGKDYGDEHYAHFDTVRIIKIGDYDKQPCGTLHVNNTSEIGSFSILSHEKTSRGTRLHCAIGMTSADHLKEVYDEYRKTAVVINPGKDKLSDAAKTLVDNNKALKKELADLKKELLQFQVKAYTALTDKVITIHEDSSLLRDIAMALVKEISDDRFLISEKDSSLAIISHDNKARDIFNSLKDELQLNGGGAPFCVCATSKLSHDELLEKLNNL